MKYLALAVIAVVALLLLRAILFRTLDARLHGRATARRPAPAGFRARAGAALAWPVFLLAVVATLVLGVLVGSFVGPN